MTPVTWPLLSRPATGAVFVALALVSCASGPTIEPDVSTTTYPGLAASLFIEVQPSLREAVRKAASQRPLLRGSAVGIQPAAPVEYTIRLSFSSLVDRRPQISNQDGAVAGGLMTMITGAVVPWPCPTKHQLSASVLRSDGTQLAQEFLQEEENRVGTMIWCPDVTEPGEALAAKMADALFRKLEQDGVFTGTGRR